MGLLEKSLLTFGMGTGEGTPLVAEQLTFHHLFVYGSTVDSYKRAGNPGAIEMDGPGKKLLTHPTLTTDVDIGIRTSGNPLGH